MTGPGAIELTADIIAAAAESKAWPFEEARKIIARYAKSGLPETVLFETGYGPSGLPHIGTFGEVARTTMVRHAFRVLTQDKVKTRLLCFSDDMVLAAAFDYALQQLNRNGTFAELYLRYFPVGFF